MSNRVYGSRKDFSEGWVLASGRYTRPGAIAEMFNTQLDLQSEGAIRQAWGMIPIAFTGTFGVGGQLLATTATGRRPGICAIETIKTGDDGEQDTVIVVTHDESSTLTAEFFHLTTPDTATRKLNYPFGTAISNIKGMVGTTYSIRYHDFVFQAGIPEDTGPPQFLATVTATGATTVSKLSSRFDFSPAAGADTITLEVSDTYTAETGSVVFSIEGITTATSDVPAGDIYCASDSLWDLVDAPIARTLTFGSIAGSPYHYQEAVTWTLDTSSSQGIFALGYAGNTYSQATFSGPVSYLTNLLPKNGPWEATSLSYGVFSVRGPGTELPLPTMTYHHFMVCGPSPANTRKEAWSTAMKKVTEVDSDVTTFAQPKNGPLGIWKAGSMNGYALWFNGYSGTSFKMDVDNPADTSTIGVDRPDASAMTLSRYSDPGQGYPRGVVYYWVSWVDDDGLESGLSVDKPFINNKGGNDYGIKVDSIPGPTTAGWTINLYRTLEGRKDPYHLVTLDKGTTSYEDRIKDADLGDPPWTHGDRPPYDAFCPVVYYDRLWVLGTRPGVTGADRTTLFWSDINEPESFWWDGNWANVYADDGDRVTAMVRAREGLVIFKNNHTYLMAGRTPDDINFVELTVEDSDTGVGCPHSDAVIATDNGIFFYWNRGIYRYWQGQVVRISEPVASLLQGRTGDFAVADVLEGGYDTRTMFGQPDWEGSGVAYDWSVSLGYDSVEEVLYVGLQGYFPLLEQGTRDGIYDPDELTLLFDVRQARWIGLYTTQFGFLQRVDLTLHRSWNILAGNHESSTENVLMGAYLSPKKYTEVLPFGAGFGAFHPLAFLSNTSLWGGVAPRYFVKFRPVGGDTGPFTLNRFLYVDYLIAEAGDSVALPINDFSQIKSRVHLDGAVSATKTQGLFVGSGPTYSNLLRHHLGLVANELEVDVEFDPQWTGDLYRLHEYSIGWQNLGREQTESPTRGGRSPAGGVGGTGIPKGLK